MNPILRLLNMTAVAFHFVLQGCTANLPTKTSSAVKPAIIDYAYFEASANRPTAVVIGSDFAKDALTNSSCQTRTRIGEKASEWQDALSIVRAAEDLYKFRTADASVAGEIIEVRVKGADGSYALPTVIGDGTNYWERFLTFGSPHDCIAKNVQVRWCQDPKPELGSPICSNTAHALACKTKNDYVVVGVHFATGSVSQVKISFDYSQIDTRNLGPISNSQLKRAVVRDDAKCPSTSSFHVVETLNAVCSPTNLQCFSAGNVVKPDAKDVAVYYMFKRNSWPAVLNINSVHIETTMIEPKRD